MLRDAAALWSLGLRIWQIIAGGGTILAVGYWLTPTQQGFYYTFASVLGLTVIFEAGLGMVLAQFASHERAHLHFIEGDIPSRLRLTGEDAALHRLVALLRHARRWYAIAAVAFLLAALPLGPLMFAHHAAGVHWRGPWAGAVIGTAGMLALTPFFTISEGCGLVAAIARVRLTQSIIGASGLWCGLALGWGLNALPLSAILACGVGAAWLMSPAAGFLRELLQRNSHDTLAWWSEVWPMQWRIAVSWICGYVIYQIFTPIVFHHIGPVAAGQMGMSLQIGQAIGTVGTAWIAAQVPHFGRAIATRDWQALDARFRFVSAISISTTAILAALVLVGSLLLAHGLPRVAARLLPPLPLTLVLVTAILNTVTVCLATYLRAHKQEPFLLNTVVGAVAMLGVAILAIRLPTIPTLTIGSLLVTALVGVGYGSLVFTRCRRAWHVPAALTPQVSHS